MKAVEEPACLSVGTDVSAKYRGAFCEAKIKTVKRLVKVKVTLKSEGTSQVVHDDQVKGQLRVGSVVEVKNSEGVNSEAVISKLTDASLYTVVFDDGDEKTLRRTSLCLKGERHFAESETLDQLPLTNPEHFGTPVIGKKTNRGRRFSQAVADEENSSSSSSEEEEDRVSDDLLGKVCSIEIPDPSLVLVVSPGCNEELMVKKDHFLVRSFGDGKFYTVPRKNVTTLSSTAISKPELCNRKGAPEALSFLSSGSVPEVWKMDLTQILESSSDSEDKTNEEEAEKQEEEQKKRSTDTESEEESDPEERDRFLQQLYKFMEDRGTPINKPPVLGYKDLNLFQLYRLVTLQGGYSNIESGTIWKQIYTELGIPVLNSAAGYNVKTAYRKYLFGFEEFCRSALITFRTEPHTPAPLTNQRPSRSPASPSTHTTTSETKTESTANHRKDEQKDSPVANQKVVKAELKDMVKLELESESDSNHEELLPSPRGRRRCVLPLKDELREARKRTPRQSEPAERCTRLTDQSERAGRLTDQLETGGRLTDQSERGSEEEEEEDEEHLLNPSERCDSDPDSDSLAGTRVRVKYGRGKTQKIYEAHIKKTDIDNGESFYLVHYYGWNVRYDEWVKGDRIIWPSEKGKKKRRGKLKNKEEPEEEEEHQLKEEHLKGPGRRGRPIGSKNKTNGRSAEQTSIANGDGTPRRRTRRTSGMFDSDHASNDSSGNSSDDSESEDLTEKKQFPWQQGREVGLKKDVDRSPKQEEEEPQSTTPPFSSTAPSTPQDSSSQSQLRAEPGPATSPERRASPLKRPLIALAPRSEPMVLLHHCLPPDPASDTDSASESNSEREDEGGLKEKERGPTTKTKEIKEEQKDQRMDEESLRSPDRNMSVKSPLRNTSARSPNPRSSTKDTTDNSPQPEGIANTRSPNMCSPNTRSPPKDRNLGNKSPLQDRSVRSPHPHSPLCAVKAETNVTRSPKPEKHLEETRTRPEQSPVHSQVQNTPEAEAKTQSSEGIQAEQEQVPAESPLQQACSSAEAEGVETNEKSDGDATPLKRKAPEQTTPDKKLKTDSEVSPKTIKPAEEEVTEETVACKKSVVMETNVVAEKDVPMETGETAVAEDTSTAVDSVLKDSSVAEDNVDRDPAVTVETVLRDPSVSVEMGVDALVCHEVDLDEPDERDKVSASEQLMLMREGLQLRVPPTIVKSPPSQVNHSDHQGAQSQQQHVETNFSHGDRGQKRLLERPHSPTVKKHKRPSHKRLHHKDKNGAAGHSSDSDDQARVSHSHKHCLSPTSRGHKWTLHIDDLEKMSSSERISFLQEKLQEIRKYYLSLKSEVASIDRRRKRLKKKEREVSNTASASSSSDAALSPSSSSPSQSSLAVEVR